VVLDGVLSHHPRSGSGCVCRGCPDEPRSHTLPPAVGFDKEPVEFGVAILARQQDREAG
jgi:hypothetical protein